MKLATDFINESSTIDLPDSKEFATINDILVNIFNKYSKDSVYDAKLSDISYTKTGKILGDKIVFEVSAPASRMSNKLSIYFNVNSAVVDIMFGSYVGNTSDSYKKLSVQIKAINNNVYSTLTYIFNNKSIENKIVKPLLAEATANAKAQARYYK